MSIDRMKLGRPVFVNYGSFNVKTVANGYAMAFDAKEIENLYPSMLAEIETAAGEEDTYALSKRPRALKSGRHQAAGSAA